MISKFSKTVPSSCFDCQALNSQHWIVQASLSPTALEFGLGVKCITIMDCIEFSKLSPDINSSLAKEDMINIVHFTLHRRASL